MTESVKFSEEERLNVYWKIKNFSFCHGIIDSHEFRLNGNRYILRLSRDSYYISNCPLLSPSKSKIDLEKRISILTCDGTQEYFVELYKYDYLHVSVNKIFGERRNSFLPEDTLTVLYRFPTTSDKGKIDICSHIGVKSKYFLWTQSNFSNRTIYFIEPVENSQLYGDIKLSLKSTGGLNTDQQLFIEISRERGEKCYYILKVSILDVDGKSHNETSDEFVFEKQDGLQTKVFPAFFKKSKLMASNNLLLPNDTLSLKCYSAMSLGSSVVHTSFTSYCKDYESLVRESDNLSMTESERKDRVSGATLQTDLKNILNDGTLFDGTLQIGTEVIKVHKNILSARSLVFKSMFTQNMKEAIDSNVVIEDLDVATVRRLLLYIYTDSVQEEEWEDIKKLYFAADKYDVSGLKKKCFSFLKTKLSVSNVCETLVLADLHQDRDLKCVAKDFISMNDTAVFTSEEWKELEKNNSQLAVGIMREIYCSKIHILD